jgi:peptide deformylase
MSQQAGRTVIHAKEWYARILQHEIDHLRGALFIDRAQSRTLTTGDNYTTFWNGKPIKEVQESLLTRVE